MLLTITLFIVSLVALFIMQRKFVSFNIRVFSALIMGLLIGILLQLLYHSDIVETLLWTNIVGTLYISLLRMIVIPLVLVSILSAIIGVYGKEGLGKSAGIIVAVLTITTIIASIVGIFVTKIFNLSMIGSNMIFGSAEAKRADNVVNMASQNGFEAFINKIVAIVPRNIFVDLSEGRDSSVVSVVFFSVLVGIATLYVMKKYPEEGEFFAKLINSFQKIIMRVVTIVLRFTPYGVLSLMLKLSATNSITDILLLGNFVLASYSALIIMFLVHYLLLFTQGFNVFTYIKKSLPAISVAFSSRSSVATIPLTSECQSSLMGVNKGIASLSATFGSVMGQNGCSGIYPAMVALMVAPAVGVNMDIMFYLSVVGAVVIASFGIAGVGGGATFASIIVLSILGLPLELIGLLISVEPLIDMGRTALNVNGAMVAGVTTANITGEIDKKTFNDKSLKEIMVD